MDKLLRNVLGDPDEAEGAEPAQEPEELEERAGEGEPSGATDARDEDGASRVAPSPGDGSADESDDAEAVMAPLDPRVAIEPVEAGPTEEAEAAPETGEEGPDVSPPGEAAPSDASVPEELVPEPPSAPERYRNESLRDLVDDLLKSLEE